jgi:branched-subunit amino acid ABC-type transport system permease component
MDWLGVTMSFGLMGIVNFAHGAFVMAGAFVVFYLDDRKPRETPGIRLQPFPRAQEPPAARRRAR